MGLFKKVFKPIRKVAKKIIPKEVRPFLPYIAAGFGPATAGLTGTAFAKAATQKALIAAATAAATDENSDPLRAGLLAITPDVTAKGLGSAGRALGNVKPDSKFAQFLTSKGTGLEATLANPSFTDSAKIVGAQTAIDQTAKLAEIQQDEMDEYNRKLREQGITNSADRRKAIRDIYLGVGYGEDYVDSMLDRYGYKGGGMTMTDEQFSTLLDSLKDDEDDEENISKYGDLAEEGFKSAFGVESLFPTAPKPMGITPGFGNLPRMAEGGDVMSPEEYFKEKGKHKKLNDFERMRQEYEEYLYKQKYGPRDSAAEGGSIGEQFEEFLMKRQRGMQDSQRRRLMEEFEQYMKRQDPTVEAAEGGLMNLGGKEMDLRGGGFVPIGKKEKADDVPARLSKNEFVMTADAVRGAGGGDVNEGAKRMYQTMDKLEARA